MVCGRTAPTELLIFFRRQTKIKPSDRCTPSLARAVPKSKNPFSLLAKRVSRALAVFVFHAVACMTGGARKLTIKSALVVKDTREAGGLSIGGPRRKPRRMLFSH